MFLKVGFSLIFAYLVSILFWVIILISKKNITVYEMYTTSFFALYFEVIVNVFFDLKYDLFGYYHKGADWIVLPAIVLLYSATNILFLNFYPYQKKITTKILYILGCSLIGVIFEMLFLKTDFFYYNGWKMWYSAVLYPFIFPILLLNLKITRRLNRRS